MNIFITTIGFLVYIVFLLSQQHKASIDAFLFHHALLSHSKKTFEEIENESRKRAIKKYRKIAPLVSKAKERHQRTNLSHKFHIDTLLSQEAELKTEKFKACQFLLKNLLNSLYKNEEFFEEAKVKYPDLEERLCLLFIDGAKNLPPQEIKHESELGKIPIEDEQLRVVFYKMMTGKKMLYASNEQKQRDEHISYFALSEYISVQSKPYLFCAYTCDETVLHACFQNPKVVQDIVECRKDMMKQISKASSEEKQALKAKLSLEFQNRFQSALPQWMNKSLVCFRISGQDRDS